MSLRCTTSKITFLIDSGASVSVVPLSFRRKTGFHPTSIPRQLKAANGTVLETLGTWTHVLHLPGLTPKPWTFVVAEVTTPIIGADLLRKWSLVLDFRHGRLFAGDPQLASPPNIAAVWTTDVIQQTLHDYKDLFATSLEGSPAIPRELDRLNLEHHIVTTGPPLFSRPRRVPPEKETAVGQEIGQMLQQGVVRPSASPWASPIHLVPKSAGGWRLCSDYRRLNTATQKDNYPLPNIFEFVSRLRGARVFSHLDLLKGFWQVPMSKPDIPKTAITTTRGLYEFTRMPFGLKNAPNSFQRLMDQVARDLEGVFVYMDDILVYSEDRDQHVKSLKALFSKMRKYGLKLSPEKSTFAKPEIEFLGFLVDSKGVRPRNGESKPFSKCPNQRLHQTLEDSWGHLISTKGSCPTCLGRLGTFIRKATRRDP